MILVKEQVRVPGHSRLLAILAVLSFLLGVARVYSSPFFGFEPRFLVEGRDPDFLSAPDGRTLVIRSGNDLVSVDLTNDMPPRQIAPNSVATTGDLTHLYFSEDGQWAAYAASGNIGLL